MECPYCDGELYDEGPYGFLASHQSGEVLGHIYRCSNHEGFSDEDEALDYLITRLNDDEDIIESSWEEVACDSCTHHVSGSFYTDKQGNLLEGYPC